MQEGTWRKTGRRPLASLMATILLGTATPAAGEGGWHRVMPLPAGPVTALVESGDGARIAAASARGVYLSTDGGRRWRRMPRPDGEVRALAFLPQGSGEPALLASGDTGAQWSADLRTWRPLDVPGLGRRGAVHAVRVGPGGGRVGFGTDDGVLIARRAAPGFGEAASALAGRSVGAIAWLGKNVLIAASPDGLYRVDPGRAGSAGRIDARPARDVAAGGGRALAITEGGLLGASPDGGWRPIGAGGGFRSGAGCVSALSGGAGSFAVADAFHVWRVGPDGPPSILAPAPPGETATAILALADGRLLGATERGLFAFEPRPAAPETAGASGPAPGRDRPVRLPEPDIASVRRAALRASSLEPDRIRRNFRGVRYRALLPDLEVSLRRRGVLTRQQDRDQSFSSGALHHLFDASLDRDDERDFVVAAEWDLGSLLFNPDELDVSEEARRVLTLRDDVLDEVNQAYFERRRALAALIRLLEAEGGGQAPAGRAEEIADLRLRIEELTARLDAWTEGFFSREQARLAEAASRGAP